MSYDPNSLQAKKGALGEEIVKKYLIGLGCEVKRPADTFKSGASIVDFEVHNPYFEEPLFIEVKTQAARPYGVENAPCYSLPKSRIDAYKKKYAELYIVDPESGYIYSNSFSELEKTTHIDARKYPFNHYVDALGGIFRYYHRNQFKAAAPIDSDDLDELRAISVEPEAKKLETEPPKTEPSQAEQQPTPTKDFVVKLAAFANIGKNDLAQAILDLRQQKFEREQAQFKELLL